MEKKLLKLVDILGSLTLKDCEKFGITGDEVAVLLAVKQKIEWPYKESIKKTEEALAKTDEERKAEEAIERIVAMLCKGERIQAIKETRTHFNLGLAEAKQITDVVHESIGKVEQYPNDAYKLWLKEKLLHNKDIGLLEAYHQTCGLHHD